MLQKSQISRMFIQEFLAAPHTIENSRQYLLLQTIILEKTILLGVHDSWGDTCTIMLCIGLLPCYNEWWFTIPLCSFQPTIERFIQMNRGINCGEDLPTDILTVGTACYLSHCFAFECANKIMMVLTCIPLSIFFLYYLSVGCTHFRLLDFFLL